jgi:hypothetical protein
MKRSKAPDVKVKAAIKTYSRDDMIVELDQAHPEYVHSFRSKDVTQRTLQLAEQEVVKEGTYGDGESSDPVVYREDIVVRRLRKDFEAEHHAQTEESADSVRPLYRENRPAFYVENDDDDWAENSPGKRVAKAKDPREVNNHGGM